MSRYLILAVLVAIVAGLAPPAAAQYGGYAERIDTYGGAPFVYHGYAYVPLRSAADFLGASLNWSTSGNWATISYRGNDLTMYIGSTQADFEGSRVRLPAPLAVVRGVLMAPAAIFGEYLDVDERWEPDENRVYFMGPPGWGYYDVLPYAPDYAIGAIEGYAPTYGPVYAPPPFLYGGTAYVPLLDWCGFFGFPVFFEPDFDDFVCVANGFEIVLAIGVRRCFFGDRDFDLRGAPCVVRNTVFVPVSFFEDTPIRAHVERTGGMIRLTGPTGVRQIHLASSAPAPLVTALPSDPQRLGIPTRPATIPGVVTRTPRPETMGIHPPVAPALAQPRGAGGRQTVGTGAPPLTSRAPAAPPQRATPQQRRAGAPPLVGPPSQGGQQPSTPAPSQRPQFQPGPPSQQPGPSQQPRFQQRPPSRQQGPPPEAGAPQGPPQQQGPPPERFAPQGPRPQGPAFGGSGPSGRMGPSGGGRGNRGGFDPSVGKAAKSPTQKSSSQKSSTASAKGKGNQQKKSQSSQAQAQSGY